jgi:hypothetical protein
MGMIGSEREDMRRKWSDDDHYWGPFTFAKSKSYRAIAIVAKSEEEKYPGCSLRFSVGAYTMIVALPNIIPAYQEKVVATYWSEADIARMGRDWYWKVDCREYGFSVSEGFAQLFYGRQPHDGDSRTEQRKGWFLPWMEWTFVRHSFYGLKGEHFWTGSENTNRLHNNYEVMRDAEDSCPSVTFAFIDFDGERLSAKTRIEEREWQKGTGYFRWLSRFVKPRVRRSLDIAFSGETGYRKGSWKGGTRGHAIEMLPGELHEAAFRRYCEGDDRRAGKPRGMVFIGEVQI